MSASDRAGSHLGWAMLCEGQQRYGEAIEAYETAIRVEPEMTGARSNLAGLLEGLASQQQGPQAAQLFQRSAELRAEELPLLERDAEPGPRQRQHSISIWLGPLPCRSNGRSDETVGESRGAIAGRR